MKFLSHDGKIITSGGKVCVEPPPFTVEVGCTADSTALSFRAYETTALVVDWGDGTTPDTYNGDSMIGHTYALAGTYVVTFVSGTGNHLEMGNPNYLFARHWQAVLSPVPVGLGITDATWMFGSTLWGPLYGTDYHSIEYCANFFDAASANCTNFAHLLDEAGDNSESGTRRYNQDMSGWNTSKVTDMTACFRYSYNFQGLGLENFDTSNVTSFSNMFFWCYAAFTGVGKVEGWNTSKVSDFSYCFWIAHMFRADISGWDFASATNMTGFLPNGWGQFTSANYDKLLARLAATVTHTAVPLDMGATKYDDQTSHDYLVNTMGWTITDGGHV